jgi:diguanylate cyclase (GGDEF)-like protein/PAS domain S-box-containing protein
MGVTTYQSNKSSQAFQIFLLQAVSFALWSFASGFEYLSTTPEQYSFWNKVGAFGWCTCEALLLWFVLVYTENRLMLFRFFKYLILFPAFLFLWMTLFLFGPGIRTSPIVTEIFYIGNFLYNFIYLALCIFLIGRWGIRSKSRIQKRQAITIVISSLIPFLLNLLCSQILPLFGMPEVPNLGQIFAIIMVAGVYFAITRFQFLSIPTPQLTHELFSELPGIAFLLDTHGMIMKANQQANIMFSSNDGTITGKSITNILSCCEINPIFADCESITQKLRFDNVPILIKTGKEIPFSITVAPLHVRSNLPRGILLIGEDMQATMKLQAEVVEHKKTNERLKNSEILFREMLEITPVAILLSSKQTRRIVYLNNEAAKTLGAENETLLETHITDLFAHQEDFEALGVGFYEDNEVRKAELELKRKDGSSFFGLITTVPSVFHEEIVALSCVVDMTDRKNTEEALKRNNEYIRELNAELMKLNRSLTEKSITDGLTGLYNHQHINDILEQHIENTKRTQQPFCVMMMDIDHFKRVNDQFGHLVGDQVLSQVANSIVTNIESSDYAGRYGGEEFLVILKNRKLDEALELAEKMRADVQDHAFGMETLKVTISIGLAPYNGEMVRTLVNKADMLMYQAKHNGRNRVEIHLNENDIQ